MFIHKNSKRKLLYFPFTMVVDGNLHKWIGECFVPVEDGAMCFVGVDG